ncbi:hypothetical protein CERSUDRAFT_136778 [Gelatoporia subvermispora B]|uniref:Uncharacterized protein n=1 Tax=Ceriporiopsis subvermispora (strain B) TaxID=914234 RepID=M2R036_CERS8|nr:hypothetical protein CERSUDRAFT_136778 [Gelatoporia subvermispora B]
MSESHLKTGLNFDRFLATHYPDVKRQHPGEGRRKWRLRVADMLWELPAEQRNLLNETYDPSVYDHADFNVDEDPLDRPEPEGEPVGFGILIRTDFSNEEAWQAFYAKIQEGEAEIAVPLSASQDEDEQMGEDSSNAVPEGPSNDLENVSLRRDAQVPPVPADQMDEDDSADEDDEESEPPHRMIFCLNPTTPEGRQRFTSMSNIRALRLFGDVDIRAAPSRPPDVKRVSPPNRLIDQGGWQEIYFSRTVWVYDAQSNIDQCARLVSSQGPDLYGTATGDSWRARASHVCELQYNIRAGIRIDFNGLDRWDYGERVRNIQEVEQRIAR